MKVTLGKLFPQLNKLHSLEYFKKKEFEENKKDFKEVLLLVQQNPNREAIFYGLRKIIVTRDRYNPERFHVKGTKGISLSIDMMMEVLEGIRAHNVVLRRKINGGH